MRSTRLAVVLLSLLLSAGLMGVLGCPKPVQEARDEGRVERTLFLGGAPVATIVEERSSSPSGTRVHRQSALLPRRDDRAVVVVSLDEDGFVVSASYTREGPRGGRRVELRSKAGRRWLEVPATGRRAALPARPVVLFDTLHLVTVPERTSVTLVDLASGEAAPGAVLPLEGAVVALDERGDWLARAFPPTESQAGGRVGPGAFEESATAPEAAVALDVSPAVPGRDTLRGPWSLDGLRLSEDALSLSGPGQERLPGGPALRLRVARELTDERPAPQAYRDPELFLESDHPDVVAFAKRHARGSAATDALALAEGIAALVDTSKGGGPPSALSTLQRRAGDCDDVTALLTASLRALGHPARAVVGYRLWRGRLEPHAWGEVYTERGWLPVDALVPGLGPFETHLRLFEGLGSPLTMGRVLGLVRPRPLDEGGSR